jgi:predicted HTH transcriptional regulator
MLHTDFYRASHRNKLLAEAFYLTGEVEKYGTGYIRIRELLRNNYSELTYHIRNLKKKNILKWTGAPISGHWLILKKNKIINKKSSC